MKSLVAIPVSGIANALDVTVGYISACALIETNGSPGGGVKCWGAGVNGQLGTGYSMPPTISHIPLTVVYEGSRLPVDNVISIKAGSRYVCALQQDGRVICWGANHWSQLGGGGARENRNSADFVLDESGNMLSGVASISTGYRHILALLSNGQVYSWGDNNYGQVGDGSIGTGVPTTPHADRTLAGPVLFVAP